VVANSENGAVRGASPTVMASAGCSPPTCASFASVRRLLTVSVASHPVGPSPNTHNLNLKPACAAPSHRAARPLNGCDEGKHEGSCDMVRHVTKACLYR
jgi:hypothetical protein